MKPRRICILLALLCCLLSFGGCKGTETRSETFYSMGTTVTVTLYTFDSKAAQEAFEGCRAMMDELEALWSRQIAESEVSRFNAAPNGLERMDDRTASLLRLSLEVFHATNGAFDVTVAPLTDLWQSCDGGDELPTEEQLLEALSHVGAEKLTLAGNGLQKSDPATALELGGIGKGAAMTALIEYLEDTDIAGGLVSFGSNVAVFGNKPNGEPFRVALRDPQNADATVGKMTLDAGKVLSVSGDYERYVTVGGKRYHHILNPKSGYPADTGLASVAVVCTDGALADALSTALFVMGKDAAMSFYASGIYSFEAVLIDHAGNVHVTEGLTADWIGD